MRVDIDFAIMNDDVPIINIGLEGGYSRESDRLIKAIKTEFKKRKDWDAYIGERSFQVMLGTKGKVKLEEVTSDIALKKLKENHHDKNVPYRFQESFLPPSFLKDTPSPYDVSPSKMLETSPTTKFDQIPLCNEVHLRPEYKELRKIEKKYDGLCDIICNAILMGNYLGKDLKENITLESLNSDKVRKSHLLGVYPFFRKVAAFFFGHHPDNVLSFSDQRKLVQDSGVNESILEKGLKSIQAGETLKVQIFSRSLFGFRGHSMLIQANSNGSYTFFDPDKGEYHNLSHFEIVSLINIQLDKKNGKEVVLIKGNDFLERLRLRDSA